MESLTKATSAAMQGGTSVRHVERLRELESEKLLETFQRL